MNMYELIDLEKQEEIMWVVPTKNPNYPSKKHDKYWKLYESKSNIWYRFDLCTEVVLFICTKLQIPSVKVSNTLDPKVAGGRLLIGKDWNCEVCIEFPPQGANGYTLLHEIAHYLEYLEVGKRRMLRYYSRVGADEHSKIFEEKLALLYKTFGFFLTGEGILEKEKNKVRS